ncbi:Coenzyme F420 hydrogenase/dehydrogenase, beta subunit C-terminal domain [Arenibacterium sp. CAU 1754]
MDSSRFDSPSLKRVARGALCAGCGACALIAPGQVRMALEEPGYLRPRQSGPLSPEAETRIAATCPGLGQAVDPAGRTDDTLWGPYVEMRTGHATADDLRFAASSGGGLSAILVHLINSGRVDAVVHNGADPDLPIANVPVISTTAEEILGGAGSRYAPSAPVAALTDLIGDTRRYAFVGKPCDVAALRALTRQDPQIAARFPVLLSFFCAGVPSLAGAAQVVEALGTSLSDTQTFRYRGNGWPGRATATLRDGSQRSMTYHDSWGKILSNHVQHRCKICADGSGVAADIVCADAWDSDENGYPLFEEADGISLIVARTALGAEILGQAEAKGEISTQPFDVAQLTIIQPGQFSRRRSLFARLSGLALLGRPIPRYRGLHIRAAARFNGLRQNIKNTLGMMRRVLRGRT